MEMENKTTKLRIVIHTLYKEGFNFQKEKSANFFFENPQFSCKNSCACRADISTLPPGGQKSGYICPLVTLPPCKTGIMLKFGYLQGY